MTTVFHYSVIAILALTAAAKLYSSFGHDRIMDFPDPLLGLPNRLVLLIVAFIELGIAASLFSNIRPQIAYLLVGWLSANFILYRLALSLLKPGKLCPCLGTITANLHLNDKTASYILSAVALYLFIGSVALYLRSSKLRARNDVTATAF